MSRIGAFENLALLRSFVSIVECGSISAGARQLRITQPTLSRQLQALEALCGTALLRRDTHRMSVTEPGKRLLADAKAILTQAEEADRRLRENYTTLSGHLRLFATFDIGQWIVTPMVSQFLQANPNMTATLSLNNRRLHMIQEGCDAGILPGKIEDDSVIARPAGKIVVLLAASRALVKHRTAVKTLADLKSWPWVSLAGSQFWSSKEVTLFSRDGKKQMLRISPVLISEGITSVREAVRDGLGVALLPDWLIKDELESGELINVLPQWRAKDVPVHVVYVGQRVLPARVSAFVDFAVRHLSRGKEGGSLK
jgi:DNA-binding transcriptional LysR family regulator